LGQKNNFNGVPPTSLGDVGHNKLLCPVFVALNLHPLPIVHMLMFDYHLVCHRCPPPLPPPSSPLLLLQLLAVS
jgi:hypothetical protein